MGNVFPSAIRSLEETVQRPVLDGFHVASLLAFLLAPVGLSPAHDAAGIPRAVPLDAEVVFVFGEDASAVGAGLVAHLSNSMPVGTC